MEQSYVKKLYERKATIYKDLNDLRSRTRKEGKLAPEDKEQFDKWNDEFNEIEDIIRIEEKAMELEDGHLNRLEEIKSEKPATEAQRYEKAFEKYWRNIPLTGDEQSTLATGFRAATASSTSVATGGYTIPEGFSYELEKAMEYTGPFTMPDGPYRPFNTSSGNKIPWPTLDDTSNDGFLQTEATEDAQDSSTGLTFSEEELDSFVYNSGIIPVSIQLVQDSFTDFGGVVGAACGDRLGRTLNYYATLGGGSGEPEGVVTGAAQGKYSASATAWTPSELIDFMASVNRIYRNPSSPKVGFMMHSLIEADVRKKDISTSNYTQPLWQPSFAAGMPNTILGYRYWVNDDMDSALTTGKKIFLFGDFSKFVLRRVGGINLFRFNERFMEKLLVAYMAWIRFDSVVIQDKAIKYFDLT